MGTVRSKPSFVFPIAPLRSRRVRPKLSPSKVVPAGPRVLSVDNTFGKVDRRVPSGGNNPREVVS